MISLQRRSPQHKTWPWGNAAADVERFLDMKIGEGDKRRILAGNASKLFNIDPGARS